MDHNQALRYHNTRPYDYGPDFILKIILNQWLTDGPD